jgi:hypothetical protein
LEKYSEAKTPSKLLFTSLGVMTELDADRKIEKQEILNELSFDVLTMAVSSAAELHVTLYNNLIAVFLSVRTYLCTV